MSQTKDLARFHTPEVLRLQQELLRAKESRNIAARQAWAELVSQVNHLIIGSVCAACHNGMYERDQPYSNADPRGNVVVFRYYSVVCVFSSLFRTKHTLFQVDEKCYEGFRTAVHALGTLDALLSLSAVAKLPGYVRPSYRPVGGDGGVDEIVLRGARHPTVERALEGGFVSNDINLRWVFGLEQHESGFVAARMCVHASAFVGRSAWIDHLLRLLYVDRWFCRISL